MAAKYKDAPEVEAMAQEIIDKHHLHLHDVTIKYVFRSEAAESGGKTVWGKARKKSGLDATLINDGEDFFVIEIAKDVWDHIPEETRVALVDHELTHCVLNEDEELKIRPHDVEEFSEIVSRHGLWREDVQLFVSACRQYRLPLDFEGQNRAAPQHSLQPQKKPASPVVNIVH